MAHLNDQSNKPMPTGPEAKPSAQRQCSILAIRMQEGQGLGNQLWTYAAARSLSEALDASFLVLNPENFKGGGFLEIDTHINRNNTESSHKRADIDWTPFRERLYYDRELDYLSSGFDERLLKLQGNILLDGLLQSEAYFFGNTQKLANYIRINASSLKRVSLRPSSCILNLRGGEYKRHKRFLLPARYWHQAMDNMQRLATISEFVIVTDDPRYAKSLLPSLPIISGSVSDCYAAIHQAQHVVTSNSTFSYFPIKTSRTPKFVIAPQYWARHNSPLNRWASPANLYRDWWWQSREGSLYSFDQCSSDAASTEWLYQSMYNVNSIYQQKRIDALRSSLPLWLRKGSKQALSRFFPQHFG